MKFSQTKSLEKFVNEVDSALLSQNNRISVQYPDEHILSWDTVGLLKANNQLLSKISGSANVYAVFTAARNSNDYRLRYIGKTKKKLARERIKNHLIKKNEKTGAKLSQVIEHIQAGGTIKISWISIQPESLRNYIEEELILKHPESNWNRENA